LISCSCFLIIIMSAEDDDKIWHDPYEELNGVNVNDAGESWLSDYAEIVGVDDGTRNSYALLPEAFVAIQGDEDFLNDDSNLINNIEEDNRNLGSPGSNPDVLLPELFNNIFSNLEKAKNFEKENQLQKSVNAITIALKSLEMAIPLQLKSTNADPRTIELLKTNQIDYIEKRQLLLNQIEIEEEALELEKAVQMSIQGISDVTIQGSDNNNNNNSTGSNSGGGSGGGGSVVGDKHESLARSLLTEALLLDEQKRSEDALPLYLQCAEQYLLAITKATELHGSNEYLNNLRKATGQVLDRIEVIKKLAAVNNAFASLEEETGKQASLNNNNQQHPQAPIVPHVAECILPIPNPPTPQVPVTGGSASSSGSSSGSSGMLTPSEVDVLRRTSKIHGRLFLPWVSDQKSERFNYSSSWEDPEGLLPLSLKQSSHLGGWRRPKDFVSGGTPIMISQVSPLVITQDLVCDCSFVASLCITAAFERRWRKRLITGIIYPQNAAGTPIVNPSGKYLVKLWANGCERRVVVDDRLPCDRNGSLMTCYSNNKRELWVSIIEKAYMKLNGGYDFPGSNSGIDLYALTGWLPEVVSLKNDLSNEEASKVWGRLESAHRFGDCLITIATGIMDESESERSGLVPTHAYAVLDVREVSASDAGTPNNLKLILVKNPWARKRWLGNYGASDERHWTPKLKQYLSYDNNIAKNIDNGIFWIDWLSLMKYFRSIHLNWNPQLFKYKTMVHHHWPKSQGPDNDSFNYGPNPQFTLTVDQSTNSTNSPATVWVLLSRHVTTKESEVNKNAHDARGGGSGTGHNNSVKNKEMEDDFIACHIYDSTGGRRVYTPKKPMLQGVYHSDPHILARFDVIMKKQKNVFTLVISQLRKKHGIDFTLQVLCTTCNIKINATPISPKYVLEKRGLWNLQNSGGPIGNVRFYTNPQWSIAIKTKSRIHIELLAPKQYYIGLRLVKNTQGRRIDNINLASMDQSESVNVEEASSGAYSSGFCYLESSTIEPGQYTLVATTYEPNQQASFLIKVFTSAPLQHFKAIPPEGDGMTLHKFDSAFTSSNGVGCKNHGNYTKNPIFRVILHSRSSLISRLFLPENITISQAMNLALYPYIPGSSNIGLPAYVSPSPLPPDAKATCITSSNKGIYTSPYCGVSIGSSSSFGGGGSSASIVLDPGTYLIIPSTFDPYYGKFRLMIYISSKDAQVTQIQ